MSSMKPLRSSRPVADPLHPGAYLPWRKPTDLKNTFSRVREQMSVGRPCRADELEPFVAAARARLRGESQ